MNISSYGPIPLLTPRQGAYKLAPSPMPAPPAPPLACTSSFSSAAHPLFPPAPPPDPPALSRPSGSESDVSQGSRGSGSLEKSKGKPLVSQYSLNLCLEVADAIVDSLGLLVELSVMEELCVESPVKSGVGSRVDSVECH